MSSSPSHSPKRSFASQSPEKAQGRHRKTSLSGLTRSRPGDVAPGSASSSSSRRETATTSSSVLSSRRTHTFFTTDDRIVLDIGARISKVGYSGEPRARAILPSLRTATPATSRMDHDTHGLLWTTDIARCADETQYTLVMYKLRGRLTYLLRRIMYDILAVDPKQRKVVVVESYFMPNVVKDAIKDVLFGTLQVASVSFVPSQLMSTVAIGRPCSIVVDLGYEQTILVPIYYWRPLVPTYLRTSTRAGARLSQRLRSLLLHFATFVTPQQIPAPTSTFTTTAVVPANERREKVSKDLLTEDFLDEIVSKALLVSPSRITQTSWTSPGKTDWKDAQPFSHLSEEDDETFMETLKEKYQDTSSALDMTIHVPPPPPPPLSPAETPSTLGGGITTQNTSRGVILIPGWVRERAAEVLFEPGDEDEESIVEMILHILLKLPVDLRTTMASNVYAVGGTAMLPGFAHRLRLELLNGLRRQPSNENVGHFQLNDLALTLPKVGLAPRQRAQRKTGNEESNTLPTESSINADSSETNAKIHNQTIPQDQNASAGLSTKDNSVPLRQASKFSSISSLATHVAVINDHAPRLSSTGEPVSGRAPAFPVNLSSWIGASLLGSLRVESLDTMTRDEWEAIQRTQDQENQSSQAGERPALGLGRGSFLGTMGGLELGSYGPLSTSARSKFVSGNHPRSPPVS